MIKMMSVIVVLVCIQFLVVSTATNRKTVISRRELVSQAAESIHVSEVLAQIKSRAPVSERFKRNNDVESEQHSLNDQNNFASVVYSGIVNSEVIYVLTYEVGDGGVTSSNVYRTTDYGMSYERIGDRIGSGALLSPPIYVSPSDHKTVYFVDAQRPILYVSNDEGATFVSRSIQPPSIDQLTIVAHPTEGEWLLALDSQNNALYVSRDLGQSSFIKIADDVSSNPSDYTWGAYPYDSDKSIVYFLSNKVLYTQQYPYTSDTSRLFDSSLEVYDSFVLIDRYIFVGNSIGDTDNAILYVSFNRGHMREAQIPTSLSLTRYVVDSLRSVQALVIATTTGGQHNLYFSDEQGLYYYESLTNLVVQSRSIQATFGPIIIDLAVDQSSNFTTYIANQYVQNGIVFKRTMISFDAGANWNLVTPPEDNETNCEPPFCSLHFHMSTSPYWRTGVYSQESAPGIIIAHGVTGQYLTDISDADLYMSNDGGSTWFMALEGTWGVDVLDHGSLIIAARDHNNDPILSRTLMYSCDEGTSWTPYTFTGNSITIFGVVTEPGETTTVVTLFGVTTSRSWILVVLDFTNIFPSICGPNDYYNWTHVDKYSENGCFLGALVTIERRKPDVCCLNTHTYSRVINYTVCSCTLEDYECDYGYKYINNVVGGVCIQDSNIVLDSCDGQTTSYTRSVGYRKIGGDVCKGGVEESLVSFNMTCATVASMLLNIDEDTNVTVNCTDSSSSDQQSYRVSLIVVSLVLVLAVLIIIGLVIYIFVQRANRRGQFDHQQFTDTTSTDLKSFS